LDFEVRKKSHEERLSVPDVSKKDFGDNSNRKNKNKENG
jgi:hypothetical protein